MAREAIQGEFANGKVLGRICCMYLVSPFGLEW